jgi:hypothetical protein
MVAHRSSTLLLDEDGLAVLTGKSVNRYRWSELLEVGWANGDFPSVGCRPIVRPRGEPYAVPGPNHPKTLGTLAISGPPGDHAGAGSIRPWGRHEAGGYSFWYITCRPTRPRSRWSNASGMVAMIWKPSDSQSATAAWLVSTTALNWMPW